MLVLVQVKNIAYKLGIETDSTVVMWCATDDMLCCAVLVQIDEYRQEITALKARIKQLTDELHASRQMAGDYESTISRLRIDIQEGSLRAEKSVIEVRHARTQARAKAADH